MPYRVHKVVSSEGIRTHMHFFFFKMQEKNNNAKLKVWLWFNKIRSTHRNRLKFTV